MNKSKLENFSKSQSQSIQPSTDENCSQNQQKFFRNTKKSQLMQKIKMLESALAKTVQEQYTLSLKQDRLLYSLQSKKQQLMSIDREIFSSQKPQAHNLPQKQRRINTTMSRTSQNQQQTLNAREYSGTVCNQGCIAFKAPANRFPPRLDDQKNKNKSNQQCVNSSKSYLNKNNSKSYIGSLLGKKKYCKEYFKVHIRYASVEQLWNQQQSKNLLRYSKNTIKNIDQQVK